MTKESVNLDINAALEQGFKAAGLGRKILLDYFGHLTQVTEKDQAGLVSEADLNSEKAIVQSILTAYPHHQILGEEQSYKDSNQGPVLDKSSTATWIIDPLDGTTNYVHGFHVYCISIGLHYCGEVVMGVIDVPKLNQTYYATKGGGAFVKEGDSIRALKVSHRYKLSDSLLATGFFAHNKPALAEQLRVFSQLVGETRGVRRAGAAAYDLCMVAEGIFDGFWEKNLSPWDTAAGSLLVREAGGVVTSYSGDSFEVQMDSILASNTGLHSALVAALKQPD